jgi:chaperone modulatory protein CbpM
MAELLTEDETISAVRRLSRRRLISFVSAEAVHPIRSDRGLRYSRVDIARLELLCDLTEDFELDGDALSLVVSLVDQLHAAHADLSALARAISDEPPETRRRLASALGRN